MYRFIPVISLDPLTTCNNAFTVFKIVVCVPAYLPEYARTTQALAIVI